MPASRPGLPCDPDRLNPIVAVAARRRALLTFLEIAASGLCPRFLQRHAVGGWKDRPAVLRSRSVTCGPTIVWSAGVTVSREDLNKMLTGRTSCLVIAIRSRRDHLYQQADQAQLRNHPPQYPRDVVPDISRSSEPSDGLYLWSYHSPSTKGRERALLSAIVRITIHAPGARVAGFCVVVERRLSAGQRLRISSGGRWRAVGV